MIADEPGLPSVSVVIPAFNATKTLSATLDSVAAQTWPPAEVFVVDDASTDDTADLARSYRDRLPQLRVIPSSRDGNGKGNGNGGRIATTRNTGIRAASGTLIAPVDADDLWHPTYLAKMARRHAEAPGELALVYCASRRVDLEGRVIHTIPAYNVEGPSFYRMLLRNMVGNGSSMVFNRRKALALGLYDERRMGNEDYQLQLKLAWHGPLGAVTEHLVGYRDVPGSVSKRLRNMTADLFGLLDGIERDFPQAAPEALRLARAQTHIHMARLQLSHRDGEPLKAPYHLARGLLYEPLYLPARTLAVVARSLRQRSRGRSRNAARRDFLSFDPAQEVDMEDRFGPRFDRSAALDARHVFPPLPVSN